MSNFNESFFTRLKHSVKIAHTGVLHGFSDDIFTGETYTELIKTFPDPETFLFVDKMNSGGGHKRFYVGPVYLSNKNFGSVYHMRHLFPAWQSVLREVGSPDFIRNLSNAIGIEFNSLNNFGFAYGDEGCKQDPHIDGAIRKDNESPIKGTIALLLYFNELPDPVSATELYDVDRKTIIAKGHTMRNSMFFFGQHADSWHGFPEVRKPHTRRVLSLAYSTESEHLPLNWSLLNSVIPIGKWQWQLARINKSRSLKN